MICNIQKWARAVKVVTGNFRAIKDRNDGAINIAVNTVAWGVSVWQWDDMKT